MALLLFSLWLIPVINTISQAAYLFPQMLLITKNCIDMRRKESDLTKDWTRPLVWEAKPLSLCRCHLLIIILITIAMIITVVIIILISSYKTQELHLNTGIKNKVNGRKSRAPGLCFIFYCGGFSTLTFWLSGRPIAPHVEKAK